MFTTSESFSSTTIVATLEVIRGSYAAEKGNSFPTLTERAASDFPTSNDLTREVCNTHSCAALYITEGASARLEDALYHNATYNASDAVGYIWNEAGLRFLQ